MACRVRSGVQLLRASQVLQDPPRQSRIDPRLYPVLASQFIQLNRSSQRRPFSNPFTPSPQKLSAFRTLPYRSSDLYNIISDISSYPKFLPYCLSSEVTSESAPDEHDRKWPRTATLKVGFGGVEEEFLSRVYCVPGQIIEAVAGEAQTSLSPETLKLYQQSQDVGEQNEAVRTSTNALFSSLKAQWRLRPYPYNPPPADGTPPQEADVSQPGRSQTETQDRTDVNLTIEAVFNNQIYAALSQAAAPKIAGTMIDAFVKRAEHVLGHKHL